MSSLSGFQKEVREWAAETFPEVQTEAVVNKLKCEVLELAERHKPAEAGDCFIILLQLAHRGGYDLLEEAKKKMEVNRGRRWGRPDGNGCIQHLEEKE